MIESGNDLYLNHLNYEMSKIVFTVHGKYCRQMAFYSTNTIHIMIWHWKRVHVKGKYYHEYFCLHYYIQFISFIFCFVEI